MRKHVYIVYTGGTIGMRKTATGYEPAPGYLQKLMAGIPELNHSSMPTYTVHEYDPLLDSSDMTPSDWLKIARDIAANYDDCDGFVVLHGTDTMAYTASALPFLLEGLGKPVILTGAQIPLCEVRNDARENLVTALIIAADFRIPEVALLFGNKLLRGNRSVKVNADGFEAFDSPNFPPLGQVGIQIRIRRGLVLSPPAPGTRLKVAPMGEPRLAVVRLFPGISAANISNLLKPPVCGAVLETFGLGNGPANDTALIAALQKAVAQGVVVVNCTQCLQGTVNMEDYATGASLARAGVISGLDMTVEAALAKMLLLFSRGLPVERIKTLLPMDLCGELTPRVPV